VVLPAPVLAYDWRVFVRVRDAEGDIREGPIVFAQD